MNNQSNIQNSQRTTPTFPGTPEPLGPVPAPSPRQAGGIPAPPLSAAVSSKNQHKPECMAIPRLVFVRAEQDARGRWTRHHHTSTGGRIPITQDGFLIQSGCECLPGDSFLTIAQLQGMVTTAKKLSKQHTEGGNSK